MAFLVRLKPVLDGTKVVYWQREPIADYVQKRRFIYDVYQPRHIICGTNSFSSHVLAHKAKKRYCEDD